MATKPSFKAANVRAKIRIDPSSLEKHNRKLKMLASVTRREVVTQALLVGGGLIQKAANAKAPGPHIGIEVVTGAQLARNWGSKGVPRWVNPEALYVAIGPDKPHWYYRFYEYGVKAHGVKRRKRTRYAQYLKKQGVSYAKSRRYRTGTGQRNVASTRPSMVFTIDGRLIFARKVSGFAAKPFLRPAADSQGEAAVQAVGRALAKEIAKVARS